MVRYLSKFYAIENMLVFATALFFYNQAMFYVWIHHFFHISSKYMNMHMPVPSLICPSNIYPIVLKVVWSSYRLFYYSPSS